MAWWSHVLPPGLFTEPFMVNAFVGGTLVAIVAALTGFFVVLRGLAFVAHALPKIGFAGAAGAVLVGINPLIGLVAFATGGALSMGLLGKRGRNDVVIALTLVVALGAGALFLVISDTYATGAYALLFGQLVGVSRPQVVATAVIAVACALALGVLYRPLLFAAVARESAAARGIRLRGLELAFLAVIGVVSAITVPVVGALLSFSLMIAPAAAAPYLTHRPGRAAAVAVAVAVVTVWVALILGYDTGWPIGFYVAALTALFYGGVRLAARVRGN